MLQLTLAQSMVMVSTAGAAWLMVRAGVAKKQLSLRGPSRCASCGRKFTGRTCSCTTHGH